jgi:glycosyltransferase involved in cell wall biosynthesis
MAYLKHFEMTNSARATANGLGREGTADISVVVPNYNHAALLPEAIASLRAQTLSPIEIIIVDDGSTDDSSAVIDGLAATDLRIRVIKLDSNRGAIAAINIGVGEARGRFLAMVAADDITQPDLFEVLHAALSVAPGAALASAEVKLIDMQGAGLGYRPPARPSFATRHFNPAETAALLRRIDNFILTGATLFDRRLLVEAGSLRPDLGSLADGYAAKQLALRHGFVFVPKVLAQWRINPAGLSRGTATQLESADALTRIATTAFASDPAFPATYAKSFESRWRFAVLRLALADPRATAKVIAHFSPGPRVLRKLFCSLAMFGRPGRCAALAWATLWYRPTSPMAVLMTHLARRRAN